MRNLTTYIIQVEIVSLEYSELAFDSEHWEILWYRFLQFLSNRYCIGASW